MREEGRCPHLEARRVYTDADAESLPAPVCGNVLHARLLPGDIPEYNTTSTVVPMHSVST